MICSGGYYLGKVSKDSPLSEITLRKYEAPEDISGRDLVKKLCLSLGLLQPGDSRDVIVDVLYIMLTAKEALTSADVEKQVVQFREDNKLQLLGVASSNIRRQLLRLRDLFILEKVKNFYRIREGSQLHTIFEENVERYYLRSIITRVKEYLKKADEEFLG